MFVKRITQTTDCIFTKFYGKVGHNPDTNQLDLEWPWPKVKVTRGQKVKILFCEYSIQNYIESCHKKWSLCRWRWDGCGHSEIDYSSLKMQFKTTCTIELECIVNGLPWLRFALSLCNHSCGWTNHVELWCGFVAHHTCSSVLFA